MALRIRTTASSACHSSRRSCVVRWVRSPHTCLSASGAGFAAALDHQQLEHQQPHKLTFNHSLIGTSGLLAPIMAR